MAHQLAARLHSELAQSQSSLERLAADAALHETLLTVVDASVAALQAGRKLLFAGNGGSAAECQHIAAEFVSRFRFDRPALPAIALTTDTSALTAIGNDYGFEQVFSRQVQAIGGAGDVLFGISTSGRSPNIVAALQAGCTRGLITVGITGQRGTALREHCHHCLIAPAEDTPQVQELHLVLVHLICGLCEQACFGQ